jgi:hypothetical protein
MFSKKPKMTKKPLKVLTGEELETVTGGLSADFLFGDTLFVITADANSHDVYVVKHGSTTRHKG